MFKELNTNFNKSIQPSSSIYQPLGDEEEICEEPANPVEPTEPVELNNKEILAPSVQNSQVSVNSAIRDSGYESLRSPVVNSIQCHTHQINTNEHEHSSNEFSSAKDEISQNLNSLQCTDNVATSSQQNIQQDLHSIARLVNTASSQHGESSQHSNRVLAAEHDQDHTYLKHPSTSQDRDVVSVTNGLPAQSNSAGVCSTQDVVADNR